MLVDECVPNAVVAELEALGCETRLVRELICGALDEEVLALAQREALCSSPKIAASDCWLWRVEGQPQA